ncbi:MAG TPA: ABC transporter ATP-binding protein [Alphaproteobacteria bacterium]|nr:ABC transporter ATP-binding protein [Alphaproteobacteria bacterium]
MSAAEEALLQVQELTIDLPAGGDRPHAVRDVSFDLHNGEVLCLVGESGSGKSVTASAIMGLLPKPYVRPSAGAIRFEGRDLLGLSEDGLRRIRGARIAMIFQEPMAALNPVMRVGDQVAELLWAHGMHSPAARARRVVELFDAVGLPDPDALRDAYPFRLSGGQRQRVMIAMALALEPSVLIADEPTTALDVTTQAQILALIRSIQLRRGIGVLFITHDFGVVAEIADRVAVMKDGGIVEMGAAEEVLNRPRHVYTSRLIAAVPRIDAPERRDVEGAAPLLHLDGISKAYVTHRGLFARGRRVQALDDVSLRIRKGETLGLVGESGSGKSTLGRCIARLTDFDTGEIRFRGVDLATLRPRAFRPYRQRIQMVFQDPYGSLNPRRKIGQIIMEGPLANGVDAPAARTRMVELLRLVGLDPAIVDRYPHEFSGGQRQRIAIARALALEPEILVADEAVSALDVSVQAQVLDLLADLRRQLDLAMLFVTHDLRVAMRICDTIAVMRSGRIVEYGPASEVFQSPQHDYTRALLEAIPGKRWITTLSSRDGAQGKMVGAG